MDSEKRPLTLDDAHNLANAIIERAVDDYRIALAKKDKNEINHLERFFYSQWFSILTNLEPDAILDRVRREFKK